MHIVFGQQINIVRYHPTIVQFNTMNQNCASCIFMSIKRISIYIRYRLGLKLTCILFFAFAIFHECISAWTMHHAFGNHLVGQPICLWIRKFSTNHAIYIFDHVWLVIFSKEDENVCMRQPTLFKLNDIDSRNCAS